ncbi:MAG: hypothetical protein M9909_05975 [Thermomicrobiales bacterium]|nr:hypothetical protein [Thermomicrobiales bacterium]
MINLSELQANPDIRYGWYLRPSRAMSDAQIRIHRSLQYQYGMIGGGVFMPHATIKGFFRSDASVAELIGAFDKAVEGHHAYTVYNAGPVSWSGRSIVIDTHHNADGSVNMPQQKLHESAWQNIMPLVHPDCDFCPREGSMENFRAHLTLAMSDLEPQMLDEVMEFVKEDGPIGPETFAAEYFHLFAFQSEDWADEWWHTLEWKLLHSWKLPQP